MVCLNCREKEQRRYSQFCSHECKQEYIYEGKDESNN